MRVLWITVAAKPDGDPQAPAAGRHM